MNLYNKDHDNKIKAFQGFKSLTYFYNIQYSEKEKSRRGEITNRI